MKFGLQIALEGGLINCLGDGGSIWHHKGIMVDRFMLIGCQLSNFLGVHLDVIGLH